MPENRDMMRRGPDETGPTFGNVTELHISAYQSKDNLASLLDKQTINIDAKTLMGQTPLHFAAWGNRPQSAILLIQHGANPKAVDIKGNTPLDHAKLNNSTSVIKVLEQADQIFSEFRKKKRKENSVRKELISVLRSDYVNAHEFFITRCAKYLPDNVFEHEKLESIHQWFRDRKIRSTTVIDNEQAQAIGALEKNVVVTARAGSGKTSTIVNRALFLRERCNIALQDILILAFNNKAAEEIRERILKALHAGATKELNIQKQMMREGFAYDSLENTRTDAITNAANNLGVTLPHVRTFHSLAHSIVHPEKDILFDDEQKGHRKLSNVVSKIVENHLKLPGWRSVVRTCMMQFFRQDLDDIERLGYLKNQDEMLAFRRSLQFISLRGDYVKSQPEKRIANFLYEHGISYGYETAVGKGWGDRAYRPDFTIFPSDKKRPRIVLEYYGIKGNSSYDEMTEAKRDYWKNNKQYRYEEIFSKNLNRDDPHALELTLKSILEKNGVPCNKLSEQKIWELIKDRAITHFDTLITQFIGRARKSKLTPQKLRTRIAQHKHINDCEVHFLRTAEKIYSDYLRKLETTGQEDFDGLIIKGASMVSGGNTMFSSNKGEGDLSRLAHLMIDEYQDFSECFNDLLKSIRSQNKDLQTYCVGDDWQAINGFAGANAKFITRAQDYHEQPLKLNLLTNHRSAREIVELGNSVMSGRGLGGETGNNIKGLVKLADVSKFRATPIERQKHDRSILIPVVLRLITAHLEHGPVQDIVLLSRTDKSRMPFYAPNSPKVSTGNSGKNTLISFTSDLKRFLPKEHRSRVTSSTVHSYKGLESDAVIILDGLVNRYPLIHPDWIFSRIFGVDEQTITDEERRLFYVGVTRAVSRLTVITDGSNTTPFLHNNVGLPRYEIDWNKIPTFDYPESEISVRIGNLNQSYTGGTINRAGQLYDEGYELDAESDWPNWFQSFSAKNFSIDLLQNQTWADNADQIEVRIYDEKQEDESRYTIKNGKWDLIDPPYPSENKHRIELDGLARWH